MSTNKLRKIYLEFFKRREHKIFPSDTLVPGDKTALFTSAGMSQFKPYFLGEKKDIKRAVSCQKCLRTGDLDRVGKTAYHHTFFEMLGNFSFGDYFKKGAIEFAWEFLLKELNLKEKDLWISIYKDDQQALDIWKNHISINPKRIVQLGEDTNFWPASAPSAGPNGVCGPCSEIFFDRGKNPACGRDDCNPDCSCGRFVEVWNLVFTQFNRVSKNTLEPLPQKNIDTGMGLERMASVLQGKDTNFDIDIFYPVVKFVREILEVKVLNQEAANMINSIVDHARAAVFSIADGVYPSNEERGYVVRKIIRRAIFRANLLGRNKPFIHRTCALFVELMNEPYPEISSKKETIIKVIKAEEEKFFLTLKAGKENLLAEIKELKDKKKNIINSKQLFNFYDTYGFPLELSKDIASKHNIEVDEEGFSILLAQQQELSRKKSKFSENVFEQGVGLKEVTKFIGYDCLEIQAQILRLLAVQVGQISVKDEKKSLEENQEGAVILDKTPFYPQSGGQMADKGWIKTKSGLFEVEEVIKAGETIIHRGKVIKGSIDQSKGICSVDGKRRLALARAHTATHLLQAALRKVLGEHVAQQGSLVDKDRLRFDFTHFEALKTEELLEVERLVNEWIGQGSLVYKQDLSYDKAKQEGALAFFEDKYKNKVRVVSIGIHSKELCGGIHLNNTSEAGFFMIVSESSISSGVRRIEAVTGGIAANRIIKELKNDLRKLEEKYSKELKDYKQIFTAQITESVFLDIAKAESFSKKEIKGITFFRYIYEKEKILNLDIAVLGRTVIDRLKSKLGPAFIFLVFSLKGQNRFICSAADDLVKKGISCKKFVSDYGKELSLKGGGKDNLVQGSRGAISCTRFIDEVENCFTEFINRISNPE
ncbi:MAG: alanine--tRNA ligase [Candidatus Omnitrophota bacterium]